MKKLLLISFILSCFSCEEVVDVELENSEPRLVVEASLLWNMEKELNTQYIKLTTTAPYFNEEIPPAIDASVSVLSPDGIEYIFKETEAGIFKNDNISSVLEGTYELTIIYNGQVYTATENYTTTTKLEEILQKNNGGFSGDDTEFKIFYTDPAEEENFYLFRFYHDELSLQIYDDEFTNGSHTFAFFSDDNLKPGEEVGFEIQGISERFYEYMYILRSQSGTAGGPFQTQPTIVKGNIINTTDPDNFPFGYFRLSETNFISYTVK